MLRVATGIPDMFIDIYYWTIQVSVIVRTDLRKSMPILEMVAGEAQERSCVSNTKLTLEPN